MSPTPPTLLLPTPTLPSMRSPTPPPTLPPTLLPLPTSPPSTPTLTPPTPPQPPCVCAPARSTSQPRSMPTLSRPRGAGPDMPHRLPYAPGASDRLAHSAVCGPGVQRLTPARDPLRLVHTRSQQARPVRGSRRREAPGASGPRTHHCQGHPSSLENTGSRSRARRLGPHSANIGRGAEFCNRSHVHGFMSGPHRSLLVLPFSGSRRGSYSP